MDLGYESDIWEYCDGDDDGDSRTDDADLWQYFEDDIDFIDAVIVAFACRASIQMLLKSNVASVAFFTKCCRSLFFVSILSRVISPR